MNILELMMKRKELIPLIAFVSVAGFGAISMGLYSLSKSDVIINKRKNPEPWENVNPNKPQKAGGLSLLQIRFHPFQAFLLPYFQASTDQ
ncbi:normal mucosa of esophagus-specific gene 1 protein isoform X1 [Sarcophilus harrisii]|uniref:normal mucosa of esophagus-specific gene 1 protein isoform X1 n=1 Tax=Sarcophilus harrisii TaxID=9305 RepID=UPI001301C7C8|nr:normal mucosa of esophagus-specific gene 1 protein isoform X1 [Sarcophilus harrisii]